MWEAASLILPVVFVSLPTLPSALACEPLQDEIRVPLQ